MPYLHTYKPPLFGIYIKDFVSFFKLYLTFQFLIDIVSVPYKKGLLPHVCTVTGKTMNI